jgi:hypothetical protein
MIKAVDSQNIDKYTYECAVKDRRTNACTKRETKKEMRVCVDTCRCDMATGEIGEKDSGRMDVKEYIYKSVFKEQRQRHYSPFTENTIDLFYFRRSSPLTRIYTS